MNFKKFISVTKALSDPNRVRALLSLRNGELCLCQIIELLSLAPSTVSRHMTILKQAGLINSRKDSRWVYYQLAEYEKNDSRLNTLIKFSISLLEHSDQIRNDDLKLTRIVAEGCTRDMVQQRT